MREWQTDTDRYLENVFGVSIDWLGGQVSGLPLYLDASYEVRSAMIGGYVYLAVSLKNPMELKPATLEKHLEKMGIQLARGDFFVVADWLPSYLRQRLVTRNIPFVVPDVQVFLPQLGLAKKELTKQTSGRKHSEPILRLSPSTTCLLIDILNRRVKPQMNVAELGRQLGYSAMTASRALNEIEHLELLPVKRIGKSRILFSDGRPLRELWTLVRPLMRNPVTLTTRINADKQMVDGVLSGETALSRRSSLAAPKEPVFAVSHSRMKLLDKQFGQAIFEDDNTTAVEVWSYSPEQTAIQGIADPFSLALIFESSTDERILISVDEMLEDLNW